MSMWLEVALNLLSESSILVVGHDVVVPEFIAHRAGLVVALELGVEVLAIDH